MQGYGNSQIEFGLERTRRGFVTIPSPVFNGDLPVTPNNTIMHEFIGDDSFNHAVITDNNGFEAAFWTNNALKKEIKNIGVPVVRSVVITDDAYTYKLMRLDHEEEMGYRPSCTHGPTF
ncbi:MAG: hypothetical protein ACR2FM_03125 [Candidatus Saccharimonadales bacterium]